MIATKKKSFNAELDDLLEGVDLPTDEEVREETGKIKRAEGLRNPTVRAKIGNTLRSSLKYKEGIKNRDQSFRDAPGYSEKHSAQQKQTVASDKWKENHKAAIAAFRNDPVKMAEYKKTNRAAYLKAKEDPAYWEAYKAGIKVRDADPEYHKKRIDASKKKICRRVQTPLGVFDSITDAANAHGMGNTETMRHRLKSPNFPDFLLLDDVAKKPQKKKK